MQRTRQALSRLLEKTKEAAQRQIPAGAIIDQLPSGALPPASGAARGGVLLSDDDPADVTTGSADAGASAAVARADHVHHAPSTSAPDYIHLVDSKASGTDGGTSTSGSWETRTLNTEKSDTGNHCSLSSSQFTLDAGTYEIRASAPANQATYHQARLQNVTDAATILSGTTEYTQSTSDNQMTRSFIMGRFTIGASKALEIQHRVASGRATYGYGIAAGGGFTVAEEIYTVVELWKVG
jgi:hypothetical protein